MCGIGFGIEGLAEVTGATCSVLAEPGRTEQKLLLEAVKGNPCHAAVEQLATLPLPVTWKLEKVLDDFVDLE